MNKGTIFNVFLPLIESIEKTTILEDDKEPVPRGSERILLVDDDQDLVASGHKLLESFGYQVTSTCHAKKALELFRSTPAAYDLVMTDQTMPDLTGTQLAEEILQIRPDTPVILCTGYSDTCSAEKVSALGIRKFLSKPLSRKEIANVVRKVLDGKD